MGYRLCVPLLLSISGACALVYQVAWTRELRLVFGASTAASACVLAVFMGGLGLGGLVLGKKADTKENPLGWYSSLEIGVAFLALASPLLIALFRQAYLALGGAQAMGDTLATLVRLLFSAAVLGTPVFLMGGTLPAAARAAFDLSDEGRRTPAFLYAANTLGAVAGAALTTFFLLEIFGTRNTIWLAALANLAVGVSARPVSRKLPAPAASVPCVENAASGTGPGAPPSKLFVLSAAALVGFVFFLMEIVWYRMLAPVLGGSTYTFGMVLIVALAGIGAGGFMYAMGDRRAPATYYGFALTCGAEAFLIALAFALGDRLAVLAGLLHSLAAAGFGAQVFAWMLVALIVVFPPALAAGYQFPLLISLLGKGGENVGRHIGLAYAANTAGAIAGALAGGFGLLPLLSAPGCWRLVAFLLAALSAWVLWLARSRENRGPALVPAGFVLLFTLFFILAQGPTAAWRHSGIGANRAGLSANSKNDIEDWRRLVRRGLVWEAEGVESSVGILQTDGLAFYINGKCDGNAVHDRGTQIMSGVISAVLHPNPRRALVVGLGTGSTAGWLADAPGIERVDVVELEEAVLEMARRSTPVNRNVLSNPKVRIHIADGREYLLCSKETYDIIISEPSNPYRAGIASLYSLEFYQSVAARLNPGGVFAKWLQGYEVDTQTVKTVYTTLGEVFPEIETWFTKTNDLHLVCRKDSARHDVTRLRTALARAPFREALVNTWGAADLEGFLAHRIAGPKLAKAVLKEGRSMGLLNTDDIMQIEFGFARSLSQPVLFETMDVHKTARETGDWPPDNLEGAVDWSLAEEYLLASDLLEDGICPVYPWISPELQDLPRLINLFTAKDYAGARRIINSLERPLRAPLLTAAAAYALADAGEITAVTLAQQIADILPAEADVARALYSQRKGNPGEALALLEKVIGYYRDTPWGNALFLQRALSQLEDLAAQDSARAESASALLEKPFCLGRANEARMGTRLFTASRVQDGAKTLLSAVKDYGPCFPWTDEFVRARRAAYAEGNDPFALEAFDDVERFDAGAPKRFTLSPAREGTAEPR
jgi:predicted membrane-bound spermidine synthase